MNPIIICLMLMLMLAYFIWRNYQNERYIDELEEEIEAIRSPRRRRRTA